MTLSERANRVITAVTVEESASASHDLLERAQIVIKHIVDARQIAADAISLRSDLDFGKPEVDPKPLPKMLKALDRRLADKSIKAVDGKDASNAEEAARTFSKRLIGWARNEWNHQHSSTTSVLEAADQVEPQGRPETLREIRQAKDRLTAVLKINPLNQRADLLASLNASTVAEARAEIRKRTERLTELISEQSKQSEELSPTIKAALKKAASEDGLPLSHVSPELLAELAEVGLADTLTVHS